MMHPGRTRTVIAILTNAHQILYLATISHLMVKKKQPEAHSAFERLHATHKILICFAVAILVYFVVPLPNAGTTSHLMASWISFSLLMLIFSWISFNITTPKEIRRQAGEQDSSRVVIFSLVLISTCASILAVILLLIAPDNKAATIDMPLAVSGMVLSWTLVHTIFTLRYAHFFYGNHSDKQGEQAGGLDFPGEEHPDYLDFAYFSFVLGMTFQVSDVDVCSKRMRRLVLMHSVLSFAFNTIIIALTINVLAGLKK